MTRSLVVRDALQELIRHLPPDLKWKVRQAFAEILDDPSVGKTLREELEGLQSYRVGRMRIVYRVEGASVVLVAIGPRTTIYQKAVLEMKRRAE